MMSNRRNLESMSALIGEWESSGLSQKQFCQQHNLKMATFAYWRKKCKIHQETVPFFSGFQEILPPTAGCVEIRYPNGVVVCLPQADVDSLKSLVRMF
jgi:hypothetical protein